MPPTIRQGVSGLRSAISSTHYLATEAGMRIYRRGGNAVDAGVAAGIALGVVERDLVDVAGVAPIMVFRPGMPAPETIDGLGRWPQDVDLDRYLELYGGDMPIGIPRTVSPGAPDAWFTALARHGTLSLGEVLEPAIELSGGFPMYPRLAMAIRAELDLLRTWPSSCAVFLPDGRVPEVGETFRQPDLQRLLLSLAEAERNAGTGDRQAAIHAARDAFYLGDPANRIAAFMAEVGGHLTTRDLARAHCEIARPTQSGYRDLEVFACGPWSQGPVLPIALNILEFEDLTRLGPGEPEYFHLCMEALKLAFADREAYFGDPGFVDVPVDRLLHKEYARIRHAMIHQRAFPALPAPGDPWWGRHPERVPRPVAGRLGAPARDTAYVAAMDIDGTAFSATPSDSGLSGPVVPGLGIVVSTRGSQFHLQADHPSALAPGKRPRLTPNPAMLFRNGGPLLAFGCPGGDSQTQAMVQVATRIVDFGLRTQEAIDYPRSITLSAPDSFHPHACEPGVIEIEDAVGEAVIQDLVSRGHTVRPTIGLSRRMGSVCAVQRVESGLVAGADPRRDCLAAAL